MTPKYTRLNCILAPRSRLLGLDGFGLVIMMMMDVFFHAQAPYSVYGKRAYGILAAYHEDHDNDDGFDDDDTPLFQDSRELTQLSAVQFMEVSALLAAWRRFKSF